MCMGECSCACVSVRECLCNINVASLRQANISSALFCTFIAVALVVFTFIFFLSTTFNVVFVFFWFFWFCCSCCLFLHGNAANYWTRNAKWRSMTERGLINQMTHARQHPYAYTHIYAQATSVYIHIYKLICICVLYVVSVLQSHIMCATR